MLAMNFSQLRALILACAAIKLSSARLGIKHHKYKLVEPPAGARLIFGQYIVVLNVRAANNQTVKLDPGSIATRLVGRVATILNVYQHSIVGFSVSGLALPYLEAILDNDLVSYVEMVRAFAQRKHESK